MHNMFVIATWCFFHSHNHTVRSRHTQTQKMCVNGRHTTQITRCNQIPNVEKFEPTPIDLPFFVRSFDRSFCSFALLSAFCFLLLLSKLTRSVFTRSPLGPITVHTNVNQWKIPNMRFVCSFGLIFGV